MSAAAAQLMQHREHLAHEVTDALYRESPDLLARHGERGREKCLQDMRYNIDHLIPAVDMGDGEMFLRYVTWLDGLLRARNVEAKHVVRCLELLRERCAEHLGADEVAEVATIIETGLAGVRS